MNKLKIHEHTLYVCSSYNRKMSKSHLIRHTGFELVKQNRFAQISECSEEKGLPHRKQKGFWICERFYEKFYESFYANRFN